jgi:hypothetical protein
MVKALTRAIVTQRIEAVFDEVYSNVYKKDKHGYEYGYKLEQCGKLYRVKKNTFGVIEYQSGWLKLNEAQAIMKLMEGNNHGDS